MRMRLLWDATRSPETARLVPSVSSPGRASALGCSGVPLTPRHWAARVRGADAGPQLRVPRSRLVPEGAVDLGLAPGARLRDMLRSLHAACRAAGAPGPARFDMARRLSKDRWLVLLGDHRLAHEPDAESFCGHRVVLDGVRV